MRGSYRKVSLTIAIWLLMAALLGSGIVKGFLPGMTVGGIVGSVTVLIWFGLI